MPPAQTISLILPAVPGYSETFFRSKIKGLQESGYRVILFVQNRERQDPIDCEVVLGPQLSGGILKRGWATLKAIASLKFRTPVRALRLWKLERKSGRGAGQALRNLILNHHILRYDLDWLHFGFATMGPGRENVARAIGAKSAVSFRGYDINLFPLKNPGIYKKLLPNIDKVHSISEDLYRKALSLGLPGETPWEKITPAIEVERFFPSQPNRWMEDGILRILTVSRLHWIKGLEYVLQALSLLKVQDIAFQLTLAGDGEEYERLKFAAYQLGITNEVAFIGRVSHGEVPALMHRHDVFVQYSFEEGFCNAVLEAQAAGMITVVSDAGGLKENVLHGETGFRVPPRDAEALAVQLEEIARMTQDQVTQLTQTAAKRVAQEFSIESQVEKFGRFYL